MFHMPVGPVARPRAREDEDRRDIGPGPLPALREAHMLAAYNFEFGITCVLLLVGGIASFIASSRWSGRGGGWFVLLGVVLLLFGVVALYFWSLVSAWVSEPPL